MYKSYIELKKQQKKIIGPLLVSFILLNTTNIFGPNIFSKLLTFLFDVFYFIVLFKLHDARRKYKQKIKRRKTS